MTARLTRRIGRAAQSAAQQPVGRPIGPRADIRVLPRTHAVSMPAVFVNVQLGWHTGFLEGQVKRHTVLRRYAPVLMCMPQESRRCFRRDLFFIRKLSHQLFVGVGAQQVPLRATMGMLSVLGDGWRTRAGGRIDHYLETDLTRHSGFSGSALADTSAWMASLAVTSRLPEGLRGPDQR